MNLLAFFTRRDPLPINPWPGRIAAPGADPGPPTYRMPYPPESGRRVRSHADDQVYVITPEGNVRLETLPGDPDEPADMRWGDLLAAGPAELLPLTDEETASARLYGRVGARWGKPGTPCAFTGCALDVGHVGPHYDQHGAGLDLTHHADRQYVDPPRGMMLRRICTCGNHAQHQPGCARYVAPLDSPEGLDQVAADLALVVPEASPESIAAAVSGESHPDLVDEPLFELTAHGGLASLVIPDPPRRSSRKTTPPPASPRKRSPRKKS